MEAESTISNTITFRNPRQERIFQKLLRLVGPGPAQFYKDACWLMALNVPIPTTTHLVSHLLRDVESALRDVLEPFIDINTIQAQGGEARQREEILSVLYALEIPKDDPVSVAWLGITGRKNIRALHARAHRNALAQPRPVDSDFRQFWADMEIVLDEVLNRFEARYLRINTHLDDLRQKKNPTRRDALFLKNNIPNNVVAFSYFFSDLTNLAWLELLVAEGLFASPPEPVKNDEEGTISYPFWPQSRYLITMAPLSPEAISNIISTIETNNASICADLVDAVCLLPPSLAAKHAKQISQWVKSAGFVIGDKIGSLVSYFTKANEIPAAAILTKEILALESGNRSKDTKVTEEKYSFPQEPLSRVHNWEYNEFIKRHYPDFVKAAPREALILVIDKLDEAIHLSGFGTTEDMRDYSEIWRPAIEDHPQNRERGEPRNALVNALRDTAVQYIKQDQDSFEKILQELEEKRWTVFRRMALYLIRLFGNDNIHLVEDHILDLDLFGHIPLRYEYMHLVQDYFSKLGDEKSNAFLGWIEKGPKIPEEEERPDAYKEYWQLRWLTILKDQLPEHWEKLRQLLLEKYSEPEHPDLLAWSSGVMTGPNSPLSTEQIKVMSTEDLIAFLDTWEKPADFTMDSPEGVSRSLTSAVSDDPVRFAADSEKLIGRDPTYVRGLLAGFNKALEAEKFFEWLPVIKLMEWVVKQGREIPERQLSDDWDEDPDWGLTRKEIAELLENGFNSTKNPIPYRSRRTVWNLLLPLTDDIDPTPIDEDKSNMDPSTISINTTRGAAFHTLIAYARWRKRNMLKRRSKKGKNFSLTDMPEVLEILEKHLDPNNERSSSIRAVYGWLFSKLAYVDHEWTLANKENIFPKNVKARQFWNAAWCSFVVFNHPSKSLIQDLHAEYLFALSWLDNTPGEIGWGNNPNKRLVEHLLTYYAWGEIDLDSELMQVFWSKASQDLRSHAIHFIGRSEKDIPAEVISRFEQLWESRLSVATKAEDKTQYIDELKDFGWWFISGAFDDNWCLDQLHDVLQITGEIEGDHMVVERLASIADSYPLRTVMLLEKLIEGDRKGWGVNFWRNDIRTLLMKALASKDDKAHQATIALINRLVARGLSDFKNLLQN